MEFVKQQLPLHKSDQHLKAHGKGNIFFNEQVIVSNVPPRFCIF